MRLVPIYQVPNTRKANPEHKVWPYLLKGIELIRPNQVWHTDIIYIPMQRGFLYLVAIMDWHSLKVLSWRLSNTLHADFCVNALKEAMDKFGKPEIFNTDQGSQFTSADWIDVLRAAGVKILMDGKGRWGNNRIVEGLWQALKYQCAYIHSFEMGSEAKREIGKWIQYYNYNAQRPIPNTAS